MKSIIENILKNGDTEWFTELLSWKKERYVIWLTHNTAPSISLLLKQFNLYNKQFNNLTIWGWQDIKTWIYYIDIWTTTNNLIKAKRLQKAFKQIAIFDLVEMREL